MTIDGINFNKLPKKTDVNKTSKEAPKGPSVEPEMTEAEKTALAKLRDSALAGYVLGLMKVAGGAAAVGGTAATLQSCIEQNQDVDVDMAPILDKLTEMMKIMNQQSEQMQQMLEYLLEMKSDNKELIDLVKDIIEQNKDISNILTSIDGTTQSVEAAMIKIVALLENANANDQEFLNKLDQIINGQAESTDKLDQILQANQEQNKLLINIEKLIEELKDSNEHISNTVDNIYNDFKDGNTSHSEMLEQILDAIKNNGNISSDILKAINDLAKQVADGQITESEMIAKIIELLTSIDGKLDGLQEAVDQIKTEFPDLAGKIDEFIQKYQEGELTEHALLSEILEEMKKATSGDTELNSKLDAILNAINQGNLTASEALDQIIDLLGKIEANTGAILEAINKISGQIADLNANFEGNQDEIMGILESINNGVGSIDSKLDKVTENQEKNNETTLEISQKLDDIYSEVSQINDKTLTMDQIQNMFGPMFDELKQYLDKISGNQITVGDLEAVLQAYKTDLTKTNGLIETLIDLVSNMNVGGDSAALQEIADAIKAFQNQSASNNAEVNANLKELLDKLASMQGSLDAIVETGNTIKDNLDKYMASATTYGNKLFDEISKIANNMVDKTTLQVYADSYTEYLQKAEQQRQEQLAVMQAIFANMGKGDGGSLTIDELKQIIPDYTDILNEINEKLGNVITSEDLEKFFINTKPDLTKTNGLIETLVDLVSNLDVSGGGSSSVDTSDLNSILNEIKTLIANQNPPTEEQMKELINLVKNAQSGDTQTRTANGTYYHQGWKYN